MLGKRIKNYRLNNGWGNMLGLRIKLGMLKLNVLLLMDLIISLLLKIRHQLGKSK
jgi:hypothetical protein